MSCTATAVYAGDANHHGSSGTATITITYTVCAAHGDDDDDGDDDHVSGRIQGHESGSTVPVKVRVCDARGRSISSRSLQAGRRRRPLLSEPHPEDRYARLSARTQRLRDEWVKTKFDTGKYKSGEIYGRPTDPALQKELEDFMKQRSVKKDNKPARASAFAKVNPPRSRPTLGD